MQNTAIAPPIKRKWKFTGLGYSWDLYFILIPALILLAVFNYAPMYGVQIAFRDFSVTKGIWGSTWVGLKHFRNFVIGSNFVIIFRNTLFLSIYSLLAGFPFPIIVALLVNKLRFEKFKKVTQTVSYAPHFISTVVLVGIITIFLAPSFGIVNIIRGMMGADKNFDFLAKPELFRHLYVWTDVWKNAGWGSIIYIAALTNVSPELYESAKIDGANKLQMMLHIDLPSIVPTVVTLLILNTGNIMSVGFEKAFLMQNNLNAATSEIISTYVYKVGIQGAQFSYSTAISMFNSIINCILLVTVNKIARTVGETSLW